MKYVLTDLIKSDSGYNNWCLKYDRISQKIKNGVGKELTDTFFYFFQLESLNRVKVNPTSIDFYFNEKQIPDRYKVESQSIIDKLTHLIEMKFGSGLKVKQALANMQVELDAE